STLRDAVGSVVDMVANPVGLLIGTQVAALTTQVAISAGTTSLDAVDRFEPNAGRLRNCACNARPRDASATHAIGLAFIWYVSGTAPCAVTRGCNAAPVRHRQDMERAMREVPLQ